MSNENRITVMLIGVVFLFLICQTPTASFLIYSNFYEPKDLATEHIHRGNQLQLQAIQNDNQPFPCSSGQHI
jgi:hypothetical protein